MLLPCVKLLEMFDAFVLTGCSLGEKPTKRSKHPVGRLCELMFVSICFYAIHQMVSEYDVLLHDKDGL